MFLYARATVFQPVGSSSLKQATLLQPVSLKAFPHQQATLLPPLTVKIFLYAIATVLQQVSLQAFPHQQATVL